MMLGGNRQMQAWFRMTAKCAMLGTLAWAPAVAEEPNLTPADAVVRLSAAYAKLDGFKAVYRAAGEGKTLECTLGLDEISGLAALHLIAKKGGHEMVARQWNTSRDQLFTAGGRICQSSKE